MRSLTRADKWIEAPGKEQSYIMAYDGGMIMVDRENLPAAHDCCMPWSPHSYLNGEAKRQPYILPE